MIVWDAFKNNPSAINIRQTYRSEVDLAFCLLEGRHGPMPPSPSIMTPLNRKETSQFGDVIFAVLLHNAPKCASLISTKRQRHHHKNNCCKGICYARISETFEIRKTRTFLELKDNVM